MNKRTILDIGRVVNVELEFTDQYQVTHSSEVALHVLNMPGMDVIIGFSDYRNQITQYCMFFLNVTEDIRDNAQKP